mgnify:CR=1 FL=1
MMICADASAWIDDRPFGYLANWARDPLFDYVGDLVEVTGTVSQDRFGDFMINVESIEYLEDEEEEDEEEEDEDEEDSEDVSFLIIILIHYK